MVAGVVARGLRGLVRAYQLSLSGVVGRQCRHLPTCSEYTMDALGRHGAWAGWWMGAARFCRCGPFGTSGLDFVCESLPPDAAWYRPWRYGKWRGTNERPPSGASLRRLEHLDVAVEAALDLEVARVDLAVVAGDQHVVALGERHGRK